MSEYWDQFSKSEIDSMHGVDEVDTDLCQDEVDTDLCQDDSFPRCGGGGCNYCLMCEY